MTKQFKWKPIFCSDNETFNDTLKAHVWAEKHVPGTKDKSLSQDQTCNMQIIEVSS